MALSREVSCVNPNSLRWSLCRAAERWIMAGWLATCLPWGRLCGAFDLLLFFVECWSLGRGVRRTTTEPV